MVIFYYIWTNNCILHAFRYRKALFLMIEITQTSIPDILGIPWRIFFFFCSSHPWDLLLPEFEKKKILAIFFRLTWMILLLAFFQPFFRQITWPSPEKNFSTSPHDFSTRFTSLGQKWKKSKFLIPFLIFFYLKQKLRKNKS